MLQNAPSKSRPVKVVIVDDTRSIRALIKAHLSRSPLISVVGEAGDPFEARELIRQLSPDVITLDVVMPKMDGLAFLDRLMRLRPMPVVMVSSRTTENSREAIKALSLGAVDCVDRAVLNGPGNQVDLAETVLMAAASNIGGFSASPALAAAAAAPAFDWNGSIVVIGSSTGGVDALLKILSSFPVNCAPTVIAQHMPQSFLISFCNRLDKNSAPTVVLASDGARLEQGHVYLAPGGDNHVVVTSRKPYRVRLVPHDGTEAYVPSVNVLFGSAQALGEDAVGVMLTGMGRDGAEAMLGMKLAGAYTIAQDSASSVVDGMPKSARELDAAIEVAGLSKIGDSIMKRVSRAKE